MNFYHLMHDDKFFDSVVDIFSHFSFIENHFIAGVEQRLAKARYIRNEKIRVLPYASPEYKRIISGISGGDVVIVHYLDKQKAEVIDQLPATTTVVWFAFGAELYASPYYSQPLHLPRTKLLLWLDPVHMLRTIRDRFRLAIYKRSAIMRVLPKIQYFATPLPSEVPLFRKCLPGLMATEVFFQYGSLESVLGEAHGFQGKPGPGVFIGNSNTAASNHADAFQFVKAMAGKTRDVVVPLSYGGDAFYRKSVMAAGRLSFGDRFYALEQFIPRSEYIGKMSTCRTAVFMHRRQQALGNIFIALWLGMKVFLLRESPGYVYLRSIGVKLFAIQECSLMDFDSALDGEAVAANRKILIAHFGETSVLARVKETITTITAKGIVAEKGG